MSLSQALNQFAQNLGRYPNTVEKSERQLQSDQPISKAYGGDESSIAGFWLLQSL